MHMYVYIQDRLTWSLVNLDQLESFSSDKHMSTTDPLLKQAHRLGSYNSFSFCASFFASRLSLSCLPVTGWCRTASEPPNVAKALWKPHSTASSTGLSNMYGSRGTAARPSYTRQRNLWGCNSMVDRGEIPQSVHNSLFSDSYYL